MSHHHPLIAVSLPLTEEARDQVYQHFLTLVEDLRATRSSNPRRYDRLIAHYNRSCDWFRDHGRRDPLLIEDENAIQQLIREWRDALRDSRFTVDRQGADRITRVICEYCCPHCSYRVRDVPRAIIYHLRLAHAQQ